MSSKQKTVYKHGITGFVELEKTIAKKYAEFDSTYWIKEYSILLYLWPFKTENIIKHQSGAFIKKKNPDGFVKLFYETIFDRYPFTLAEFKIYRDRTILQIMLDLSSALSFMHSVKIWHRDVKPQNILIDENGRATIIDFSHAHRFVIDINVLDKQVVTSYYRAPEVFKYMHDRKEPYNEKIDVWSLGIILAELVTGKVFMTTVSDGNDHAIEGIVSDPELFLKHLKSFYWNNKRTFVYARDYWQLILKMTAHIPDERPSMEKICNELIAMASEYGLVYITPVNSTKCGMRWNSSKMDYSDVPVQLINLCKVKFTDWRKQLRCNITFSQISDVLKFLYKKEMLSIDNYEYYILAVIIVLETVLFDDINEISDIAKLTDVELHTLQECIMNIVQNFDRELFVNDTFKFQEFSEIV